VSAAELAHIKAGRPVPVTTVMPMVPWRRIFTSRDVWMVVIAYFAFGYVAFIFLTWFFIYPADGRGLNLKSSAVYAMLPFIAMTTCCLAGGVISDWLCRIKGAYIGRSVFGAGTLFLTSAFLVFGSHAQGTTTAVLALAGGAGALYLGQSSYWAMAADFAGPHTGVVSGMLNMGGQIAGALTASLTPYLAARYGWSSAFYIAAGVAFVCAFAWFFVRPGTRLSPADVPVPA
jgi:ACS family glucarate transporter-like MFS transporter